MRRAELQIRKLSCRPGEERAPRPAALRGENPA